LCVIAFARQLRTLRTVLYKARKFHALRSCRLPLTWRFFLPSGVGGDVDRAVNLVSCSLCI
jgi:hypothetical protein